MATAPGRMMRALPTSVRSFSRILDEHGYECYLVGGAVRSLVMNQEPTDFDFATNARPEDVMQVFHRVIPTGVQHGTVTVLLKGWSFEVTTYRVDRAYSDGRRPDAVDYTADITLDLGRRDFTMNAIALNVQDGTLLDPYEGQGDLKRRMIRAIGDPGTRFTEDALRMLRGVRFAAQLEFTVDGATLEAMRELSSAIDAVSAERVRDELIKALKAKRPSIAFDLMRETGLLPHVVPELCEGIGVAQRGRHRFDVYAHSVAACDAADADDQDVRLAALLHDIGKPRCLSVDEFGERRFNGHDEVSAEMAGEILRRLKFPVATEKAVVHLIRHHMFAYTPEWSDAAVRRFVSRVGREWVDRLLDLRGADSAAVDGQRNTAGIEAFRLRIAEVLDGEHALSVRDLAVNGHDLATIGIPRGPAMGTVLGFLLETVLEDPALNDADRLLQIASRFYKERVGPGL